MTAIKDKLVELVAINLSKERYGDSNKSDEFLIEAELLLKHLFLDVLIDKSKNDPLEYVEFLENVKEICDWDDYYVDYIESLVFGEWSRDIWHISTFFVKNFQLMVYIKI